VMTPLAAPAMAAVSMPFIQISKRIIFLSKTLMADLDRGVRTDAFERALSYRSLGHSAGLDLRNGIIARRVNSGLVSVTITMICIRGQRGASIF
jgi:hypothetical protein